MVLAFYDLETTGFSREHNEIIQISAVAWDSSTETELDTFSTYVQPMARIPKEITDLTGISMDTVRGCPRIWEALPQFFAWLKQWNVDTMCGYNNLVFDWPFIQAKIQQFKLDMQYKFPDMPQTDLMKQVRLMEKKGQLHIKDWCLEHGMSKLSVRQQVVADYFGIVYTAHNALNDCRALKDIYLRLRNIDFNLM